jgi:GT2 family glycosyltransferase
MDLRVDSDTYDAYYYATECGRPYHRDEEWLRFFGSIADRIVRDIGPSIVCDVGCAMGFLVEALRQRGVDAFGVDISEYAIQNVHPDIQPYCWVGSVTDPFPGKYDLIVCIEVLEHLPHRAAEQAVANLCRYSDDILFSSTPLDYKEATHFNVQPPQYWAELFARHGLFRDVDYDASFVTSWAARFRKTREPVARVIAAYERRFWQLQRENQARCELSIQQRSELAGKEQSLQVLSAQVADKEQVVQALSTQAAAKEQVAQALSAQAAAKEQAVQRLTVEVAEKELALEALRVQTQELAADLSSWEVRWARLEGSAGWALLRRLQLLRLRVAPVGSRRERLLKAVFRGLRMRKREAFIGLMRFIAREIPWQAKRLLWETELQADRSLIERVVQIDPIRPRAPVQVHQATVDIIVCVHNALSDIRCCLEAVVRHTTPPYSLILVDDGSEPETHSYLFGFAKARGAVLLTNEEAKGYTWSANQGLRRSSADYVVLLNSDTVVTAEWLDRLIACAASDPQIALVGPLSNTASWQSIPDTERQSDWAANPLPVGMTIEEMAHLVAQYSARLYPSMPFLNGFCLLIRRQVIEEIGYFDEEAFGPGYGEENDYAIRARKAGWLLSLADDTYVYHSQSRSYSTDARQHLAKRADILLAKKHGQQIISEGVAICRHSRTLEGIRVRSRVMLARQEWLNKGQARFAGRRVLFLLPIAAPGGGGNVVITEALAMRSMGVDVGIFNLEAHRRTFEDGYPKLGIPVLYGEREDLATFGSEYDAIIATLYTSVEWLKDLIAPGRRPVRGYYVQDFEPYLFRPGTEAFQAAMASYLLLPDLVRVTKTEWTRQEVKAQIGAECTLVGPSVNIDLFRPRPRCRPVSPEDRIRIVAMVRPSTPRRAPKLTMELLRQTSQRYGDRVEIIIFGTSLDDPGFHKLPRGFAWSLAGVLNQNQVARLLNEADVFVDFSSHQAMGLTALEAMACGVGVIVPERGGAVDFARHEENSLVVDTSSSETCWRALQRMIEDHGLRSRLQKSALASVCKFFPEHSAFRILDALFDA